MRRQLRLLTPYLSGDDVAAVQRALGGLVVDGAYGPLTAARVRQWKWASGYPSNRINAILGPEGQALLLGESEPPPEFASRAERRRTRLVRPLGTELGPHSEFAIPNPHGAPAANGVRYHAAKDWFAPPGTTVRAPATGTVVEARSDPRTAGPIFGGSVKVEDRLGRVWVFRHVDPRTAVGRRLRAGDVVATVARWQSGPSHAHVEVWKTLAGGYRYENMLDPMTFFG